jgi:hypothetical protein
MLWFDEARDYGLVLTDDGERLYVDRDGFVDGAAPVGRCARRPVTEPSASAMAAPAAGGTLLSVDAREQLAYTRGSV